MKTGSQVKKGMAIVSSTMEVSLANWLDSVSGERGERHAKLEKLLRKWLKVHASGVMPSVYIGARSQFSIQRTYYLTEKTAEDLKKVADEDGVSVSHVVRTAFAWAMAGGKKPRDVWGTKTLFDTARNVA